MIFEFNLSPIEEIRPWGEPPEQTIHWFALTLGEYRLKVGQDYLLNYTEEIQNYYAQNYPQYQLNKSTFVDYQVVRLWEDIIDILPNTLEPVPKELRHFLEADYAVQSDLRRKADQWEESQSKQGRDEDEIWETIEFTDFWLINRHLNSCYLSPSSNIWIWSDEENVIFSWDNTGIEIEGIPVWSATRGSYTVKRYEFIEELRDFDRRLFKQMNERVEKICSQPKNPEILIDCEHLRVDHDSRATWMESWFKSNRQTDWPKVISALKTINS